MIKEIEKDDNKFWELPLCKNLKDSKPIEVVELILDVTSNGADPRSKLVQMTRSADEVSSTNSLIMDIEEKIEIINLTLAKKGKLF